MGHSIGDGIVTLALAAAFLGYFYFKFRAKQHRLDIIHQERLAAMDKGIPLPELPIDPPEAIRRPDPRVPLILGIVLLAVGGGSMIALHFVAEMARGGFWTLPLPVALVGLGLMLYHFLAGTRER